MIPATVLRIDCKEPKTEAGHYCSSPTKGLGEEAAAVVRIAQIVDIALK